MGYELTLNNNLSSSKSKQTKNSREDSPGLTGYYHDGVPNFSFMAQPLFVFLKWDRPDPIQRNPEGKRAEDTLEEVFSKAPTLGHLRYKLSS